MPESSKASESKATAKANEAEINRLRAQIRELQAELSRQQSNRADYEEDEEWDYSRRAPARRAPYRRGSYNRSAYGSATPRRRKYSDALDDATDVVTDLPARLMDEASKFVRGLTFAYLEQMRVAADVMNTFADEVFTRNRPDTDDDREMSSARARGRRAEGREDWDEDEDLEQDEEFYRDLSARASRRGRSQGRYASGRASERYRVTYEEDEEFDDDRESRRSRRQDDREGRQSRRRPTLTTLAAELPADMYSGFARAIDRALDIPGAAADRFTETYRESDEEAEPTLSRARRRSAERESPISEERQEIRIERESSGETETHKEHGSSRESRS